MTTFTGTGTRGRTLSKETQREKDTRRFKPKDLHFYETFEGETLPKMMVNMWPLEPTVTSGIPSFKGTQKQGKRGIAYDTYGQPFISTIFYFLSDFPAMMAHNKRVSASYVAPTPPKPWIWNGLEYVVQ